MTTDQALQAITILEQAAGRSPGNKADHLTFEKIALSLKEHIKTYTQKEVPKPNEEN